MRVLLFGATGMVGQGVLRECLLDPGVELVQTVGRSATGMENEKLREVVHADLFDYSAIAAGLTGFDACFFCLGVTSSGMKEADYERVTYGIPVAAAETLARLNPQMAFVFVSGTGADSSEHGRVMWARIKGKAENALLRVPLRTVCVFRPGFIEPRNGARSKTTSYRVAYTLGKPLFPLLRLLLPNYVLTTEQIGLAMLMVARRGAPKPILESRDIRALVSG